MNTGKKFEALIKLSADEQEFDITRMKDGRGNTFDRSRLVMSKNVCDFILYKNGLIFYIEAKHSKDRLTFSRLTQQKDLMAKYNNKIEGVNCGYLLSIKGMVFYVSASDMQGLINNIGKKSINPDDISSYRVPMVLPKRKKKYRIKLDTLLDKI